MENQPESAAKPETARCEPAVAADDAAGAGSVAVVFDFCHSHR
jgi:hypothetical protein